MSSFAKNDKRIINGWCMYDWANSVYALTITTAVFPIYFYGVTGGKGFNVDFFGLSVNNTVLYSYTLAAAFLIVAFLNPILSGIADFGGNKKQYMKFFCYLGSISCASLYFFDGTSIEVGVIGFGLASIGFAGSLVFYNSFLPEIATEDQFDHVSAKGFSLGYVGSVILLIFNLILIMKKDWFGIELDDNSTAPKLCFLSVGIWWAGFAQITFNRLPDSVGSDVQVANKVTQGFKELKKVWVQLKSLKQTRLFLLAFALYSLGTQTVMYMATIFGEEVVDMEEAELIGLVLVLQLIAIPGAYGFSYLSSKKGNLYSIKASLIVWVAVCIAAYFLTGGMKIEYFVIGIFVGLVMGGVQSMSRSTYAKLIPAKTDDTASFFSFYETLEKVSIAMGTFIYGLVRQQTNDISNSALVLTLFFVAGLIVLQFMKKIKASSEDA